MNERVEKFKFDAAAECAEGGKMSELKAINLNSMGCYNINEPIYLKSEADKVIAHNKYKRCLAMARWCKESLRLMRTYEVTDDYWNLEPGQDAEYFCKKGDFYSKWRKRWLALAEEPTWAKFLQLIHKEAKLCVTFIKT